MYIPSNMSYCTESERVLPPVPAGWLGAPVASHTETNEMFRWLVSSMVAFEPVRIEDNGGGSSSSQLVIVSTYLCGAPTAACSVRNHRALTPHLSAGMHSGKEWNCCWIRIAVNGFLRIHCSMGAGSSRSGATPHAGSCHTARLEMFHLSCRAQESNQSHNPDYLQGSAATRTIS